jgi:hypothetical protein
VGVLVLGLVRDLMAELEGAGVFLKMTPIPDLAELVKRVLVGWSRYRLPGACIVVDYLILVVG